MRWDPVERFAVAVVIILVAAVLGVAAWGIISEVTEIQAGAVVDKGHFEEITTLVPVASGNNSFILVPVTQPECWAIYMRDGDRTGDVCTSKEVWDRVKVGEWFGR